MPGARKLRFASFEVDLDSQELRNRGIRVRLQHKPFQVLQLFLENPGLLITRGDLIRQLWPGLHVNFENGLNTAVNTLRQILGDSPRRSRFIETLPGLGYRFLVPVEVIHGSDFGVQREEQRTTSHSNFDALQDFLKGQHFCNKISDADLRKGIAYFESAIRQDPNFAAAHAGLAGAYCLGALLGMMPPEDARQRANRSIAKAVRIDEKLPETMVIRSSVEKLFDLSWHDAEEKYLRVLEENPAHPGVRRAYSRLLAVTGRLPEAIQEIRHAETLDPGSLVTGMEMAGILYLARDYEAAIDKAWSVLVLEPQFAAAQLILGLAYEQAGMLEEALAELQNARSCSGNNPATIAALGHALWIGGDPEKARQILQELNEMALRRYVSPYWKGVVYAGMEHRELALQALWECWQQRDVWLVLLRTDPRLDPVRGCRAFDRLLEVVERQSDKDA